MADTSSYSLEARVRVTRVSDYTVHSVCLIFISLSLSFVSWEIKNNFRESQELLIGNYVLFTNILNFINDPLS